MQALADLVEPLYAKLQGVRLSNEPVPLLKAVDVLRAVEEHSALLKELPPDQALAQTSDLLCVMEQLGVCFRFDDGRDADASYAFLGLLPDATANDVGVCWPIPMQAASPCSRKPTGRSSAR